MTIIRYLIQGDTINALIQLIVYALILIVLIPIHEYSHAKAAYKLGDDTQKWTGRLTLNPAKHLDFMGSVLLVLFGFGWGKPVKVNNRNFKNHRTGMALTAAAGPISNIIVAIAATIVARIFYIFAASSLFCYVLSTLFNMMASLSISLAFFNLIPVPPLDGSRIFALVLPDKVISGIERYSLYFVIGLMALLRFTPVGDWLHTLIGYVDAGIYLGIDALFRLMGV
ncbi:MAG: site-2 protease family protein [Clostridia bacterium]|nr:site-2 protease family protein [Clostridia bacterium]